MSTVTLNGYIIVPESELSSVLDELPNHIALTQAEPGCMHFSVVQNSDNVLRFEVSEQFRDRTSFEKHQQRVRESFWGEVTRNVERHYVITGIES